MKIDVEKLKQLIQEFSTSVTAVGYCRAGATIGEMEGKIIELTVTTAEEARRMGNRATPLERYKCIEEGEIKPKRYVYFVSFIVDDTYRGWAEVELGREITCAADISEMGPKLVATFDWGDYSGRRQIMPVNFILLRTEEV